MLVWVWNHPTNHAVNGAEEHRALGGRGALAQILQHQWAMAEDIDKLPEVEDPHLLKVLPLLVRGGSTDRGKDGGRETQRGEKERLQTLGDETCRMWREEPTEGGEIESKSERKKMSKGKVRNI